MTGYAGATYLDPTGAGRRQQRADHHYLHQNMGYGNIVTTDWLPSGAWINAAQAGADVMGGADPGATGFAMSDFQPGADRPDQRLGTES